SDEVAGRDSIYSLAVADEPDPNVRGRDLTACYEILHCLKHRLWRPAKIERASIRDREGVKFLLVGLLAQQFPVDPIGDIDKLVLSLILISFFKGQFERFRGH